MTQGFKLTLMWIVAAIGALVVAVAPLSAAVADGHYLPVGPDGFYHARRILDAVADPSAFFQFDTMTHVPEGNLVTWPWAYDWFLSLLVRIALALHLASDPMAALAHIPVIAFAASLLLVMSICRSLNLSPALTFIAMLASAFSPLNQSIYSVGNIDHHYAEHLFVLGTLATTLAWLRHPDSRGRAIAAGVVFGLATGVHSALFALQLPLLGTLLLCKLRGQPLPRHTVAFAASLVLAQLVIALPSLPLQRGVFDYTMLSWFQPYIALCTAAAVLLLARLPHSGRGYAILAGVSLVLLVPTVRQVLHASDFFTNSIGAMGEISEVRSVLTLWRTASLEFVTGVYTWLIVLLPLGVLVCAAWIFKPRDAIRLHFALASLAGSLLLLAQARLHYFGSFALFLPWLVLIADLAESRPRWAPGATAAAALVAVAAYLPSFSSRVFAPHILSEDPNYSVTRGVYPPLARECAGDPGLVLADPYDGHYIRFHTGCKVLANNFLVTRLDVEKVLEEQRLLKLPARELAAAAPAVRYVFARSDSIFTMDANTGQLIFSTGNFADPSNYPLVRELLTTDPAALPPGWRLVFELRPAENLPPYARLFALPRAGGPAP